MENLKGQASLFILGRAVWPTFDTYCDIIIGLYCIVYANVLVWGLVMVAPLIYHLVSVTSSYVRMRRESLLEKNDLTWIAIPFFMWPQIQAGKVGRAMWHEEQDWEKKKDQHERHESRNQSIIEGVMQSLIVAYIVVQKYYEENPDFAGYDSFWTSMLVLMTISALGSLVAGIVNLFKILRTWPLRMELGSGKGNKILLATIIIFGVLSRFGAIGIAFIFFTGYLPTGAALQSLALFILAVIFIGFQLTLCLLPLQGFGPGRFWNLFLSFPNIHIIPLITPFTFGLVCDKGCLCHCWSCCGGCSNPKLALSRSLTLANHIVTLLLMIPPMVAFYYLGNWDLGVVQLCIAVLGLLALPILLFQPGRIVRLGVLDPGNIGTQLISKVENGRRVFNLAAAQLVEDTDDDVAVA